MLHIATFYYYVIGDWPFKLLGRYDTGGGFIYCLKRVLIKTNFTETRNYLLTVLLTNECDIREFAPPIVLLSAWVFWVSVFLLQSQGDVLLYIYT